MRRGLDPTGKQKPSLPLVHLKDNKFDTDKDALAMLRTLEDKPVAVLGICGPYRSGKSYFASRIIRGEDFEVGHKRGTCTRGIWMATSVLECEKFYVVVLDTEGAGAAEATERDLEENVNKYLIITTLLCSYLIYNSKGISSGHLNDLR